MIPLFIGLTIVNLLCLSLTATLGYMSVGGYNVRAAHVLAGALSTLACCGVHCVVFTYFIATAKWIQHAVLVKHLDPAFITPTRSFKMQAFPAALLAIGTVFIAACLGAARDNYAIPRVWHHSFAIGAMVVNVLMAIIEYRAISRNGSLIDSILAEVNSQEAMPPPKIATAPPGIEAPRIDASRHPGEHAPASPTWTSPP